VDTADHKIVILEGDPDGEHLRLEREGDVLVFAGQILRMTGVNTDFRQMYMISIDRSKLIRALKQVGAL
jgi:DNA/RNA endonuclease YhcR with UshA esterase domain